MREEYSDVHSTEALCFTYIDFAYCMLKKKHSVKNYSLSVLLSISVRNHYVFGSKGTTQRTAHEIVFGTWRLLSHLDSNPHRTRAAATLLCDRQSAVQCMSGWASARDICTHNKPQALICCVNFPSLVSASHTPLSFLIQSVPERLEFPISPTSNTATFSCNNAV